MPNYVLVIRGIELGIGGGYKICPLTSIIIFRVGWFCWGIGACTFGQRGSGRLIGFQGVMPEKVPHETYGFS